MSHLRVNGEVLTKQPAGKKVCVVGRIVGRGGGSAVLRSTDDRDVTVTMPASMVLDGVGEKTFVEVYGTVRSGTVVDMTDYGVMGEVLDAHTYNEFVALATAGPYAKLLDLNAMLASAPAH